MKGEYFLNRLSNCQYHTFKKDLFYCLEVRGQVSHPYKAAQSTLVIIQRRKGKEHEFAS
jgi:hypothetical protein